MNSAPGCTVVKLSVERATFMYPCVHFAKEPFVNQSLYRIISDKTKKQQDIYETTSNGKKGSRSIRFCILYNLRFPETPNGNSHFITILCDK
jgi:hypothetical protein